MAFVWSCCGKSRERREKAGPLYRVLQPKGPAQCILGRTLPPKKIFQAGQCPKANNIRCCALVGGRFLALASVRPACGRGPSQKSGEKWCLGGDGISCSAPAPKGTRGRWCLTPFGTAQESKTRKAPPPLKDLGEKRKRRKGKRGERKKNKKRKEKPRHPGFPRGPPPWY